MESPGSHSYYELKILEHVEAAPDLPRRVAASKLGVSVKLAHKLITGLVERGLLHVKKENSRQWRYFLTARGLAEKARLTREFIEFSFEFYREARRRSAQVCRDLSEAGMRRIAFLGLGELAEITYLGVQEWGLELTEVFDWERVGRMFFGCRVRPPAEMASAQAERIVVTSFDPENPMGPGFLPASVQADRRMVWIFGEMCEGGSRENLQWSAAQAAGANDTGGTEPDR
jgi:predicted transcriptional regulator